MVEVYGLGSLIVLGLAVWAIVSIVGSNASSGTKVLWVLFVLLLPVLGFIVWFIAGPKASPRSA